MLPQTTPLMSWTLRGVLLCAAVAALSSCAGTDYGGTNYATVSTGTESWKIVGAKDEQAVKFKVTRADGTIVEYSADGSNASQVLGQLAVAQQQQTAALTTLLGQLAPMLAKIAVPVAP